ncbi:MAG TPA: alpha-hydroxy acid oxidase [Baekduia sp.]|jgi:isopentenyl diphosphate isomerase/L-lactate dehydrogenase-like FMN-dependent dehydrogenase
MSRSPSRGRHGALLRGLLKPAPPALERAHSVGDIRRLARSRTPIMAFDFVDGGAEDELTLRANRAAFERASFSSRVLVEVADRDLSTTALGTPLSMPVILGPTGTPAFQHPDAELAASRAAVAAGTVLAVSTAGSYTVGEVAAVTDGPLWFQLNPSNDPGLTDHLIDRARAAGCTALIVTVDCSVGGPRERDLRNGWTASPRLTRTNVRDALVHPDRLVRWGLRFRRGPGVYLANIAGYGGHDTVGWITAMFDERQTWAGLERIRERWGGPLAIKGIMSAADARLAAEVGADGIVISNHGGRQLDGLPGTLEVLPEIADALAGSGVEVLIDGGVRRGGDVAKALALGARACLIARPWVWGLGAAGEAGVSRVLAILRGELDRTLALLGVTSVHDLDRSFMRYADNYGNRYEGHQSGTGGGGA